MTLRMQRLPSQQGVYLYSLISQLKGAKQETAMGDFAQMRQALESGVIDAYVSERPEALTAESANSKFKMIQFKKGFEVGEEDATIAIGMKKGDTRIDQVNATLAKISSEDQVKLMDDMIKKQPASSDASDDEQTFFSQMMKILKDNGPQFLRGTGMTLLISMTGTIAGLIIGC